MCTLVIIQFTYIQCLGEKTHFKMFSTLTLTQFCRMDHLSTSTHSEETFCKKEKKKRVTFAVLVALARF